jgi:ribonuclease HI
MWWKDAQQDITDSYECSSYQANTNNLHEREATLESQQWRKPHQGFLKCNYDCSLFRTGENGKAGWIIRDDRRFFIEATQSRGKPCNSVIEAELHALLMVMQHTWIRGYRNITFKGDNKQIPHLINGEIQNFGVHNLTKEVQTRQKRFTNATFTWIPRHCNKAADCLAKKLIPANVNFIQHFFVPRSLVQILHEDHFSN